MPPRTEADIRASLDEVIGDLEQNQRIYGWFAGNVGQIARDVRDLSGRMDQRFEQVDQRFNQVDQRFEQVDQRFEQVDQRFNQVDQRLDGLDQRVDGLETNMNLQFGLVHDSLRKLDARMERMVGYIVRDERKENEIKEEGSTGERIKAST